MRAVVQRVDHACVRVEGRIVGEIGPGLLVYVAIGSADKPDDIQAMAGKVCHLRVFPDDTGTMNRSVLDLGGSVLVVSQFTLYGDVRRGRRPSYTAAAPPEAARAAYERFLLLLAERVAAVRAGVFQESMDVESVNHGPVTILIDTERTF